MNMSELYENELYQYAAANYENGGHWIAETYSLADYNELLADCAGNVNKAKQKLEDRWKLICEQERNCAW
jgi:hypothetical protein